MTVASTVLTMARGLLNDPDPGSVMTDIRLIPLLDLSSRELQLMLFGVDSLELKEISAFLTVPINTPTLNAAAGYPSDVIKPVELAERDFGSTDFFTPLEEREWEPDILPDNWIKFWAYRDSGEVRINPATVAKQIRFKYLKSLAIITAAGSTIPIPQSEVWLAYRTAELAAVTIGENPSRAAALLPNRLLAESKLIGGTVKGGQNSPARHRKRRRTWR